VKGRLSRSLTMLCLLALRGFAQKPAAFSD